LLVSGLLILWIKKVFIKAVDRCNSFSLPLTAYSLNRFSLFIAGQALTFYLNPEMVLKEKGSRIPGVEGSSEKLKS
jgi:hypothetical protein